MWIYHCFFFFKCTFSYKGSIWVYVNFDTSLRARVQVWVFFFSLTWAFWKVVQGSEIKVRLSGGILWQVLETRVICWKHSVKWLWDILIHTRCFVNLESWHFCYSRGSSKLQVWITWQEVLAAWVFLGNDVMWVSLSVIHTRAGKKPSSFWCPTPSLTFLRSQYYSKFSLLPERTTFFF